MSTPTLFYTEAESLEANANWKANCGPHSLAAACGKSIGEVGRNLPDFPGWMGPTQLQTALLKLRFLYRVELIEPKSRVDWKWKKERDEARLVRGTGARIARIQWEGEWLGPNIPKAASYKHTHWIALKDQHVLDTVICAWKWIPLSEWKLEIEKHCVETNTQGWHFTHWYHLRKSNI